jgi:hypothetical protein
VAVLIGGGVFFFSKTVFLKNRVTQTVVASKNVEVDVRYELWGAAVRMWKDYVWFGMGPGHFDHRFRAYRPAAIQLQPDRVHNDYLNTLVDWGVIGAAIITLALGALFAGWQEPGTTSVGRERIQVKPKQQIRLRSGFCGRAGRFAGAFGRGFQYANSRQRHSRHQPPGAALPAICGLRPSATG